MKSGIHHWLVFVGMKAAGNKFILEEGTCDSNMLKGSCEVISILLVCKRRKGDNARTASFFIIYCLVEAQPGLYWDGALSCNLGAPVTCSWKRWAGKSYTGVESAIRHLRCSESLYQEIFQLCYSTSGFPWSADPEMWVCLIAIWGYLLKDSQLSQPFPSQRFWFRRSRVEPSDVYFDKLFSLLAIK